MLRSTDKNRTQKYLLAGVALILLLSLVLVQSFRRAAHRLSSDFFYPFMRAGNIAEDSISNKSLLLKSKVTLASALEELGKKHSQLSAQVAELESLQKENAKLRGLLKMAQPSATWNCIFAEVLVRDPVFWDESFTINKGSEGGISPGALVLTCVADPDSASPVPVVAGRITSVSKHSAVVSTIVSKDCVLSVRLPASGATGITRGGVRYGNGHKVSIFYLPRSLAYEPGQLVCTSGLSQWTPPGLRVGVLSGKDNTVEGIFHDNLNKELKMEPAVRLDEIRFVMVMVGK